MAFALRLRPLLALLSITLVATLLGANTLSQAAELRPRQSVLVLGGGVAAADRAVVDALAARGLDVTLGPDATSFEERANELRDVSVVVLLNNTGPNLRLSNATANTLARYVERGGALVVGQWSLLDPRLAPIMPAVHCGQNDATSTTFTRTTPNPRLVEGVPAELSVALTAVPGSEGCLQPRDEATVLYASSNGGGRRDAAGLVAWNSGEGRVAAFSILLGTSELAGDGFRTLFQSVVEWLVFTADTTPPRVRSFEVSGQGAMVADRTLSIVLDATDRGGSGLGSYLIREFAFSGNTNRAWEQVAESGWLPYGPGGVNRTWTLGERPGVHYLQVFVADRAGNISRRAVVAAVNYNPPQARVAQDELHVYRITPGPRLTATVRMTVLDHASGGNPDLYVFGPNVAFHPESNDPVEQTSFTTRNGEYQIEVEGFRPGSYTLSVALARRDDDDDFVPLEPPAADPDRRPRVSFNVLDPPTPPDDPVDLPMPPADPVEVNSQTTVYLPLLRR